MSEIWKEAAQPWEDAGAGKPPPGTSSCYELAPGLAARKGRRKLVVILGQRGPCGQGIWEGVPEPAQCGLSRLEIQSQTFYNPISQRHQVLPGHTAQLGHEVTTPNPSSQHSPEPLPLHHPCPHQAGTHLTENTVSWREEAPFLPLPAPNTLLYPHSSCPAPTTRSPSTLGHSGLLQEL